MSETGEHIPEQEVAEVNKLAVPLVLNVDYTPSVLATANGLALDDHVALGTNNRKWNNALLKVGKLGCGVHEASILTRIRSFRDVSSSSLSS